MAFRFFDIVLGRRLKEGMKLSDAKAEASDAVELRYGICKKTLQNLMKDHHTAASVSDTQFAFDNAVLADHLREVNEELRRMLSDNERLLGILEEIDEDLH